jgi:uncharacterized membrane protein
LIAEIVISTEFPHVHSVRSIRQERSFRDHAPARGVIGVSAYHCFVASESLSIDISAAPERVWRVITDVESWPQWTRSMTTVKRLDDGPLRVGSQARIKQPGLPKLVWQVTGITEGAEFTWVTRTPGVSTTATHRLDETPAGVRLTLAVAWDGIFAGVVAALAGKRTREYLALETAGAKTRAEAA